jgi:hypothetical protein
VINELPDETSLAEIVDRIEFLAAIQKGIDQLDRGEGISRADFILPHSSFPSALSLPFHPSSFRIHPFLPPSALSLPFHPSSFILPPSEECSGSCS